MEINEELKEQAWRRLWADKWFGRLFGGGLLLGLCGYAMNVVVGGVLSRLDVPDWQEYVLALAKNRADVTSPIPKMTNDFIFQASSSMALELFLSFIMAGIAAYGGAVILRKCLANDEPHWLGEAFGGFKMPFGMLWLFLRRWLIGLAWGLLAGLPMGGAIAVVLFVLKAIGDEPGVGILAASTVLSTAAAFAMIAIALVPFYRYRYLWLVKADHPDWSAGECLRFCRALMKGNLMRAVRLDCAYWRPITLVLALAACLGGSFTAAACGIGPILTGFAAFLSFSGLVAASIVVGQYVGVGQGFLYRELLVEQAVHKQET